MNKVMVNKQQNVESQDQGMRLGLSMARPAPGTGVGISLGPVPTLLPPSQYHRQAWCRYFGKSHFGCWYFWLMYFGMFHWAASLSLNGSHVLLMDKESVPKISQLFPALSQE